jgi:DNA modification methylase
MAASSSGGTTLATAATNVRSARQALFEKYRDRMAVNEALNRSLVSYQSNRQRPFFRWFKYKEGFSAALVEYVLDHFGLRSGCLLDPFAGSGASCLVAAERGFDTVAMELLPVGARVIQARLAAGTVDKRRFAEQVDAFHTGRWKAEAKPRFAFPHLKITQGAFADETEQHLNQFRTYLATRRLDSDVRDLLELACLNVLEQISYTRKDGQYLRWDHRAPRKRKGRSFDKGRIFEFPDAMNRQLAMMSDDINEVDRLSAHETVHKGTVRIVEGSCLDTLPTLATDSVDVVVTSPPYCNRYDYTRTYALELAYLGITETELKTLRQKLLSCTVENRSKIESLRAQYGQTGEPEVFERALASFDRQSALQEVLSLLDCYNQQGSLNNRNIPRMVRNYFLESAVVIGELARVVRSGGRVVMVNDNVQYGGEEVPVDLILSDLAADAGFETECIWVLPRGKGNSSQQMGAHGRNELRKCVYLWYRADSKA